MRLKACAAGALLLALTAPLFGCSSYPLPGPLVYGKCGPDAHTEAYPLAKHERRAYGCKKNQEGYLETGAQGDQPRN